MEGTALTEIALPLALAIIMIGVGLSLTPKDFKEVSARPLPLLAGFIIQLVVVPILGFLIAGTLGSATLAVGIVLVAILPGGTTSNMFTYLAKGNLALSIVMTVTVSMVTIITIPPLINFAFERFTESGQVVRLDFFRTVITIAAIVVIPTVIGMLIRHFATAFADRFESLISAFSAAVLIGIVILIAIKEWNNLPGWIASSWHMVAILNFAALALGYFVPKLLGATNRDAIAIGIESSLKNTTLGITIAISLIGNTELSIPAAVYGLLMFPVAFLMVVIGRRQDKAS